MEFGDLRTLVKIIFLFGCRCALIVRNIILTSALSYEANAVGGRPRYDRSQ